MGRRPQTQEPRGILLRSEQSLHVSFGGVHPISRSLSSRFPRASGPVCLNTDMALCWWCEAREADSKEHKYKRKDLLRLMGEGEGLVWFGDDDLHHDLQGKGALKRDRYKILKFQKSLCSTCNNARSISSRTTSPVMIQASIAAGPYPCTKCTILNPRRNGSISGDT